MLYSAIIILGLNFITMAYKTKLKIMFNVSMCLDLAMVPDEFQPQLRTLKDDITPS